MKMLVFLIVFALIITALVWKMRKSQAEELLAKRKDLERRKKQQREAMTPEIDMVWPVIIKPVTGKRPPGEDESVPEPMMTAIEFAPSDHLVEQQSRQSKAAG